MEEIVWRIILFLAKWLSQRARELVAYWKVFHGK
jgi:hypothetical protein